MGGIVFNPYDPKQIKRLCGAVNESRRKLETFRNNRTALIKEFVGSKYSDNGSGHKVIANNLAEAVDVTVMHLAPTIPKVLISTDYQEYKVVARDMEIAINNDFHEVLLEQCLKEVVTDAWFAMGIVKIGLAEGRKIDIAGKMIDAGQLSVSPVSLDNWVHDTSAKRWDDCDFYGDLYRIRKSELITSDEFENKEGLFNESEQEPYNEFGGERTSGITTDNEWKGDDSSLFDYIEVFDIFLPKDQLLITIPKRPDESYNYKPLRVVEWSGPKRGPYKFLSLSDVPENIIPNAPGMQLNELNTLIGNLMRKLDDQSARQKTVGVTDAADEQAVNNIMTARDGEVVTSQDPKAIQEVRFGGPDNQMQGFAVWAMDLFDRLGGNVRAMGGTGQSADTLGQEQLVFQQLGVRLEKQKQKVRSLVAEIARDVAWWRWHDEFYSPTVVRRVPNTNVSVRGKWGRQDRLGNFIDYNFNIDPYSMEYVPPSAKLRTVQEFINTFILPLMPMMEQQGVTLNMEGIIKMASRYSNTPEILDAFTFMEGEQTGRPQPMGKETVSRPAVTRRENVRINKSSGQQSAQDKMLADFLGGNMQVNSTNGNGGVQV